MRGQRRARDVPVQYSTGTVQCRYSTGTVQHCTGTGKKIPGGAGTHTGHTGTGVQVLYCGRSPKMAGAFGSPIFLRERAGEHGVHI